MALGLLEEGAGPVGIALQDRMLGELAQIMRGDAPALLLQVGGQVVEHLERVRPVALLLVDSQQVLERVAAILA